uniref:Discoidin, CUB and LCCL domain containing 2 n=1 Tax=Callorhinchus milii TaxID=7868 RepID=A0A4W3K6W3_CALMI
IIIILAFDKVPLTSGGRDGCGHTVLGPESGTLASINYPETYPNNTVCEWEIRVQPGERILFKFGDFDIEDSTSCHMSYLRLYNGVGPNRSEIGKYCGLSLQEEKLIESESNEVTVQFMSGIHVSGRGFLVSYSTTNQSDFITCLDKGSHFSEPEVSKYCPAGCLTPFGEISGTIPHGYRDSSLLCKAAVHAGVVSNYLGGRINVVISKGIPLYVSTLANNVSSKLGPLSASLFTFKTSGCYGTLGMESGIIGDGQITASSALQWHDSSGQFHVWGPEKARLKQQGSPWAACLTDEHQWLQIDLKKEKRITGIITTGSTLGEYSFYISAYRILYRDDKQKWKMYREANGDQGKIFQGNANNYQEVRNNFIPPILARYIRIIPVQWHQKAALKVELLGCQPAQLSLGKRICFAVRAPSQSVPPPLSTEIPLTLIETTFTPDVKNTSVKSNVTKDIVSLAGWWKGMKQFLPAKTAEPEESDVRYTSSEMSRLRARDVGKLIQTEPAEYAQPLVARVVGTLRQRSTFKPEEDPEAGYTDPDGDCRYDAPGTEIYHAYAEPLPVSSPEYATPIVMEIAGYPSGGLGPVVASSFKSAGVSVVSPSPASPTIEPAPPGQAQYDTPKGTVASVTEEQLTYQVPQSLPQATTVADTG